MRRRSEKGATLLEITMAMLVIALVAAGIMSAFVFSRQVTFRSSEELTAADFARQITDQLRMAVQADLANGLTLTPGIYVDQNMATAPAGSAPLAALNLPANFLRFQNNAVDPNTGHSDGVVLFVEDDAVDRDGDGQRGIDFQNDGDLDMTRVRIRVQFTTPTG